MAQEIKRRREGKRADDRKVRDAITEAMPKLAFTSPPFSHGILHCLVFKT